jgi:hypothetical protein
MLTEILQLPMPISMSMAPPMSIDAVDDAVGADDTMPAISIEVVVAIAIELLMLIPDISMLEK